MKQNLIIFLLVVLVFLLGFLILSRPAQSKYFIPAPPDQSSENISSSPSCQRYDVVQGVRKHLQCYNRNYNSGLWEYWAEELSSNSSYKFDITQSGNTFIAKVSTKRRGPYGNESIVDVGTFSFLCSNNGKLTLSSAFGIFDD